MCSHLCLENKTKQVAAIMISHGGLTVCKKKIAPGGYITLKNLLNRNALWVANAVVNIDHVEYCTGKYEFSLASSCLNVVHQIQEGMDFIFMENAISTSANDVVCYNTTRGYLELQLAQVASCYTARVGITSGESYSHHLADRFKLNVIVNGITLNPFVIDNDIQHIHIISHGGQFLPSYSIQV